MKLKFKGTIKNIDQLPKSDLPENAVKFKEPNSFLMLNIVACIIVAFSIVIFIRIVDLILIIKKVEFYTTDITKAGISYWVALLFILPREFLRALVLTKKEEIDFYFIPKYLSLFSIITTPIKKSRYILMTIFPSLVFNVIPFILWVISPPESAFAGIMLGFSFSHLIFGSIDLLNFFNALVQMPRNSMQQMSGLNSYWFMAEDKKEELSMKAE